MDVKEAKRQLMYDLIIKKAKERIKSGGLVEMTMADLAKDVGVAKGTLYNYFSSKEEIILNLVNYNNEVILEKISEITQTDASLEDKMCQIIDVTEGEIVKQPKECLKYIMTTMNSLKTHKYIEHQNKVCIKICEIFENSSTIKDVELFIKIVFSLITTELMTYVNDNRTPDQLLFDMKQQVKLIIRKEY